MIEPTTGLFYSIINQIFGSRATFATRAVANIQLVDEDSPFIHTLAIGAEGVIFVNKGFWRKMIKTRLDAEIVFLHELFHSITGDTQKLRRLDKFERQLANISMDMRINAAITQCFLQKKIVNSGEKHLLSRMYTPTGITGLLRPGSSYGTQSKYRIIYNSLYADRNVRNTQEAIDKSKEIFKSEDSIRKALEILIPKEQRKNNAKMVFIGSHEFDEEEKEEDPELMEGEGEDPDPNSEVEKEMKPTECSSETKEQIREALSEALKEKLKDPQSGIGSLLIDNMLQVIESNREINFKALDKFTCNHNVNKIKAMFEKERRVTSVVPIRPSSREMSMVANGIIPAFWKNIDHFRAHKNKNIAIYLDVSGSVTMYLPKLLGIIKNLNKGIQTIYCFSTIVSEHSATELNKGIYKTTGGTDFDCIGKHVLENKIDKCVIFTDGYADIYKIDRLELKKQLQDAAVVYFGDSVNKQNFFQTEYGKGFDLDEVS